MNETKSHPLRPVIYACLMFWVFVVLMLVLIF